MYSYNNLLSILNIFSAGEIMITSIRINEEKKLLVKRNSLLAVV